MSEQRELLLQMRMEVTEMTLLLRSVICETGKGHLTGHKDRGKSSQNISENPEVENLNAHTENVNTVRHEPHKGVQSVNNTQHGVMSSDKPQPTQAEPSGALGESVDMRLSTSFSDIVQQDGQLQDGTQHNRSSRRAEHQKPAHKSNGRLLSGTPPHKGRRKLAGLKAERGTALYVEHIQTMEDDSEEDIIKCVKDYAEHGGIRVMSAKVIKNRFCQDVVGCKVFIPEKQIRLACSPSFWPDPVSCRVWEDRVRNRDWGEFAPRGSAKQRYREMKGDYTDENTDEYDGHQSGRRYNDDQMNSYHS